MSNFSGYDAWKTDCYDPYENEPDDKGDDGKAEWETEMFDYAEAKNICTTHSPPPIPMRQFDWVALPENYDLGSPSGYGATEAEAIFDLKEQLENK